MESRESAEMYLETIYLLEKSHGHAHGVDIANKLGISKASVSKAIKKLQTEGLLKHESYGTINLTQQGIDVSEGIYRKHTLIYKFLKQSLEISDKEASENACRMEHTVSEQLLNSIEDYLDKSNIEIQ